MCNSIVRFISAGDAIKYVLREVSTFCLHNAEYYRDLDDNSIRDEMENEADFREKHRCYLMNGVQVLVSCWTLLENDTVSSPDWNIFSDKQGIAIVSTVSKIRGFLEEKLKWLFEKGVIKQFEDSAVTYYGKEFPSGFNKQKDITSLYFYKRKDKYESQREYRFACRLSHDSNIQSLVFYASPRDYIESIYIYPEIGREDFDKILEGSINAGIFDLIKNYDYFNGLKNIVEKI